MKSTILSIVSCILVILGTLLMVKNFPSFILNFIEEETPIVKEEEAETLPYSSSSREFIIETAHDAEDLILDFAHGKEKDYEKKFGELILRLDQSSKTLKDEYQDYVGANWFSKVSNLFSAIVSNPFSGTGDFNTRVSLLLYELENAYPAEAAESLSEDDASKMYYPKFDTSPSGSTSLAMLSIYRLQFQKSTGSILLTFGGNTVFGDTLLGAEEENSFKNSLAENGSTYPFYNLYAILKNDTISFANLEAPLTNSVTTSVAAGSIKGTPAYADALKLNGIDLLSISGPGVLSYGADGHSDTIAALNKSKLSFTDEGIVSYQNTEIGVVAYLTYNIIDEIDADNDVKYIEAPKQDIAAAKVAGAKMVVVHFNWDTSEARDWDPCLGQIYTARAAIDNGADLVYGTHPSSIQSIERYNGKSIIYSPGNLFKIGEESDSPFLFQQAFRLDENGNVVPGEIMIIPLGNTNGEENGPTLLLDEDSADTIKAKIKTVSNGLKYGAGKLDGNGNPRKDCISLDELGIISISKKQ